MDQLDREQDRKRPRLDSGGKAPSDEALTDVGCPADETISPSSLPRVNDQGTNSEATALVSHISPDSPMSNMEGSPTKPSGTVTINTRPSLNTNPGNESAPEENLGKLEESSFTQADAPTDKPEPDSAEARHVATSMTIQSPESQSVRLHSKSPEIQVAAPEDIDGNVEDTTWHSIASLQTQPQPRLSALEIFANGDDLRSMKDLIGHMNAASQAARLGRDHQMVWLNFVKSGLQEYLSLHPHFLYNELHSERIFWISLATFTENLLAPQ